jgi:hypothetical protein
VRRLYHRSLQIWALRLFSTSSIPEVDELKALKLINLGRLRGLAVECTLRELRAVVCRLFPQIWLGTLLLLSWYLPGVRPSASDLFRGAWLLPGSADLLRRCTAVSDEYSSLVGIKDLLSALLSREHGTFVEVAAGKALAAEDVALVVPVPREDSDIAARLLHLVQARVVGQSHALGL